MKALIIDDEKHVREAIKLLVPWEQFGIHHILEASDGQSAISIIQAENPAILFTDMMMPRMGGVELLEWASAHAPASKIIVVSGHEDFELVRQTVKYGGMDYLLKPIDEAQLITALTKAIKDWKADEEIRSRDRNRNMEINQLKPVYLDKFFSTVLSVHGENTAVHETLQQQFGIDQKIQQARVCVLTLELAPPSIRKKFQAGWDLLYFSLTNICNEFLRRQGSGFAFRYWGEENEIVIIYWKNNEPAEAILTEINEGIFRALNVKLAFGIGETTLFPEQLHLSYRQARSNIRHRNLKLTRNWSQPSASAEPVNKNTIYFSEYEPRIRYAIQGGDKEQLEAALAAWFKAIEQSESITLEQLHHWKLEFRLAQTSWMNNSLEQSSFARETQILTVVDDQGSFTLEEWKQYFEGEAHTMLELLSVGSSRNQSSMQAIAKYIDKFLHEDLSLQDISNRFFLSREYISRKFKQEMNENLTDYITRIRIERAKSLLADTQLKIAHISEKVGFQDEKYFSKVFKKWTDCSPNEYRKQAFGGK
ncbi:response regulator [Cohnella sp.]|uniref:response regulator n=1 Tax=Cohnella sp. TaxID=1883426 RepID=UPI003562BFA3